MKAGRRVRAGLPEELVLWEPTPHWDGLMLRGFTGQRNDPLVLVCWCWCDLGQRRAASEIWAAALLGCNSAENGSSIDLLEPVGRNRQIIPAPRKRRGGERACLNFLIASDLC